MANTRTLHQRRRPLRPGESNTIPWLTQLEPETLAMAMDAIWVSEAQPGDHVCRAGRPVTYWFGLIDGLLKMSTANQDGKTMTFTGLPPGGWFGEGTVLKKEIYRYDVLALRKSTVAGISVDMFHELLNRSIAFNRFVMHQLNERLGQFIAARETDRMNNPNQRVSRSLLSLFNPELFPHAGNMLKITQQELADLAGLSRQRVNQALSDLEKIGAIRVEYGGLRVLNWQLLSAPAF